MRHTRPLTRWLLGAALLAPLATLACAEQPGKKKEEPPPAEDDDEKDATKDGNKGAKPAAVKPAEAKPAADEAAPVGDAAPAEGAGDDKPPQ